ncbi:MAG: AlpA family phage regulatory protein [Roseitalea sp.]|nr:AlpA family phage regulatory protein [Roseitalea sp.]MBO6952786.1 AlpA family phage regulatory protein [Rhizobiaceae bacterium]MBO6673417.1 AlpA family phage regulatory protein [Roseitalea sp.]MBO6706834.1 AlpA family phage regulatory protein [Roseitalea sp.]MBO6733837.1 AlpA family phage regulatory protein [Roseitalea sp.]
MAASKKLSTSKRDTAKCRRSQASSNGDLFAPLNGQDDLDCRKDVADLCQFEPAGRNAYADASQPGSPRLLQQGACPSKRTPSSDSISAHENPSADGGQASKPGDDPAEPERLAIGSDRSSPTTEPQFYAVMTDRQVADYFQVSRATIWRWQKEAPGFPRSFTVGGKTTRWYRRDIEEYLRRRMAGRPD